jgi:hypothetical protein
MRSSRYLMAGAIGLCFILAVLITATFMRFLKQKTDNYNALDAAYDELKNEVQERRLAEEALEQSATAAASSISCSIPAECEFIIDTPSIRYANPDRGIYNQLINLPMKLNFSAVDIRGLCN